MKAERAYDAARRAYSGGDIDAETWGRDRAHFETEIDMLRQELGRMRAAAEERQRQHATAEQVNAWASRWGEVRDALTEEEKRELVWALVKDATVSPEDDVMVTGTLTGLGVCIGEEGGSPTDEIVQPLEADFALAGRIAG